MGNPAKRDDPQRRKKSDGESSNAGKLRRAARVPAKPLGEDGILNQNPIFEIGSSISSPRHNLSYTEDGNPTRKFSVVTLRTINEVANN
jgi:hypothetical protein